MHEPAFKRVFLLTIFALISLFICLTPQNVRSEDIKRVGIVSEEFLYENAPFPSCHASTIVETNSGLVAAFFGGTREGDQDVGIWLTRHVDGKWTAPAEVANGIDGDQRFPTWNPVLFKTKPDQLALFYKVGPSPSRWWGMLKTSTDDGKSWSEATRLPQDILGPVRNKPIALHGKLLCGSSTEHDGWRVHFEIADSDLKSWQRIGPINDGKTFGVIQPTILQWPNGRLLALCRSQQNRIVQTWSDDQGQTWSELEKTDLPNPNSGIDGVTLKNGTQLLIYNHTIRNGPSPHGREMLNVATSVDGKSWNAALVLEKEKGEFSYPSVIQTGDGKVHILYTYQRKQIKHVVVDPTKLQGEPIKDGNWPGIKQSEQGQAKQN